MAMSQINIFMSNDAVNEDAESPEPERGTWSVVAGKQCGRSSDHIGARARHLAAASVSVSPRCACGWTCDTGWRTVGSGNVQDSSRRARAIACLFQAQRSAAERDCHPCRREVFDRGAPARKTWLSVLQSLLLFVWNSLSIACSPPSYNKSTGYWLQTSFAQ